MTLKKAEGKRIEDILEKLGLAERGDNMPGQLSGGEMQRVAIGRALINQPGIIQADEATGNLDSANSEMIFSLFRELNESGLSLVVVTHNPDLARRADKMYALRDGRMAVYEGQTGCG